MVDSVFGFAGKRNRVFRKKIFFLYFKLEFLFVGRGKVVNFLDVFRRFNFEIVIFFFISVVYIIRRRLERRCWKKISFFEEDVFGWRWMVVIVL